MTMGFTIEQATYALKLVENNVERAVDWILSNTDENSHIPMETDIDPKEATYRNGGSRKYI